MFNCKNSFGFHIPGLGEIVRDAPVWSTIRRALKWSLVELGVRPMQAESDLDDLWEMIVKHKGDQKVVEAQMHNRLGRYMMSARYATVLQQRAELAFLQIEEHIPPAASILDLGCGDGLIGKELAHSGHKVHLADVLDYRHPDCLDTPWIQLPGEGLLPIKDNRFDVVLLLTVLHHANDPLTLLKESARICKKRIVVIESVVGSEGFNEAVGVDLRQMPLADQVKYAAVCDWFYNRVLHRDVNTPFNFTTSSSWVGYLESLGFTITACVELGIDQALVAENHVLIVADKKAIA